MLIGSSGVGKSTLINQLLRKEAVLTNEVRTDGKGRHTTTTTKMLKMDLTGSYIIDSPGFKTISTTSSIDEDVLFEDIKRLSESCKFKDCSHIHEPGCAVLIAVETGDITEIYYQRYLENMRVINGQKKHEETKKKWRFIFEEK